MPDSLILRRGSFFRSKEFEKLYELYADDSVIKRFFNDSSEYKEYMLNNNTMLILSEKIVRVRARGSLANVVYVEELLMPDGILQSFVVSTYLRLENGCWFIIKDDRRLR